MRMALALLFSALFVTTILFGQNKPAEQKKPPVAPALPAKNAEPKKTPASTPKPAESKVNARPLTEDMYKKLVREVVALNATRDEAKKMEYMKRLAATPYEATFKLMPPQVCNLCFLRFALTCTNFEKRIMRLNLCFASEVTETGHLRGLGNFESIERTFSADEALEKRMKNGMKTFSVKVVFYFDENGINDFRTYRLYNGLQAWMSARKKVSSIKLYDGATLLYECEQK